MHRKNRRKKPITARQVTEDCDGTKSSFREDDLLKSEEIFTDTSSFEEEFYTKDFATNRPKTKFCRRRRGGYASSITPEIKKSGKKTHSALENKSIEYIKENQKLNESIESLKENITSQNIKKNNLCKKNPGTESERR